MRTPVVEAAEDEPTDNAAATRLRLEAQATRRIADGQAVAEALTLLDEAVLQLSARSLPTFSERVARLHAMAKARLRRAQGRAGA